MCRGRPATPRSWRRNLGSRTRLTPSNVTNERLRAVDKATDTAVRSAALRTLISLMRSDRSVVAPRASIAVRTPTVQTEARGGNRGDDRASADRGVKDRDADLFSRSR